MCKWQMNKCLTKKSLLGAIFLFFFAYDKKKQ